MTRIQLIAGLAGAVALAAGSLSAQAAPARPMGPSTSEVNQSAAAEQVHWRGRGYGYGNRGYYSAPIYRHRHHHWRRW